MLCDDMILKIAGYAGGYALSRMLLLNKRIGAMLQHARRKLALSRFPLFMSKMPAVEINSSVEKFARCSKLIAAQNTPFIGQNAWYKEHYLINIASYFYFLNIKLQPAINNMIKIEFINAPNMFIYILHVRHHLTGGWTLEVVGKLYARDAARHLITYKCIRMPAPVFGYQIEYGMSFTDFGNFHALSDKDVILVAVMRYDLMFFPNTIITVDSHTNITTLAEN